MNNTYLTLKNRALSVYDLILSKKKQIYPVMHLNSIYNEIDEIYINFIEKYLSSDNGDGLDNNELYIIKMFIESTNALILQLLQNASVIKNPKAITIPILEKIMKDTESALFIPELIWEVNYYIGEVSESYNNFINDIGLECGLSKKIYRIGIPYFYQDDVLMSGIIGHELGHYFDLYGGLDISEKLLTYFVNDNDLINSLTKFVISEDETVSDDNIKVREKTVRMFLTDSRYYFKNWIKEFVADCLGVILYGPSSIFSTEYLIQSMSLQKDEILDRSSMTHPRNKIRYSIKKRTLEMLEYEETFYPSFFSNEVKKNEKKWEKAKKIYDEGAIKITDITSSDTSKAVGININEESLYILENYLYNKSDYIVEKCKKMIDPSLIYTPKILKETLPTLSDKIGKLLPPNEINKDNPSDVISIINAGWHEYFSPSELLIDKYPLDYQRLKAINDLLRRALEVSYIHRRWIDVST